MHFLSFRWLLQKGRQYSAVRGLEWLRGKDDRVLVEAEVKFIMTYFIDYC